MACLASQSSKISRADRILSARAAVQAAKALLRAEAQDEFLKTHFSYQDPNGDIVIDHTALREYRANQEKQRGFVQATKDHREHGGWVHQNWKQGIRKPDIPNLDGGHGVAPGWAQPQEMLPKFLTGARQTQGPVYSWHEMSGMEEAHAWVEDSGEDDFYAGHNVEQVRQNLQDQAKNNGNIHSASWADMCDSDTEDEEYA